MNGRGRFFAVLSAAAIAWAAVPAAHAQNVVRVVVGGPPGGLFDIALRNVSAQLEKSLGATVVIDNKPGAGGAVAVEYVKNAKPDGLTVGMINVAAAANESIIRNKGYNLLTDLEPVGMYVYPSNILIVHPDVKATTVPALVDELKARGSANYSSGGIGSGRGRGSLKPRHAGCPSSGRPNRGSPASPPPRGHCLPP